MAGNHVLLETISLTQTVSSITFDNIPQTGYTDLKLVGLTRLGNSGFYGVMQHKINNTSANYTVKNLNAYNGSVTGETGTTSYIRIDTDGNTATSNTFGNYELYIPNYLSGTSKTFSFEWTVPTNSSNYYHGFGGGVWANNSAVSSIVIDSEGFLANSTFSLYGVAATGTTPTVAPKATGGNIVANDGTYWYHAFTSSGTFTPQTPLTCNILQIAGGGSGGYSSPGGGGAGGLLGFTGESLTATNYTVTVGAGGAARGATGGNGNQGSNSQFGSLTASVGGGYGGYGGSAGGNGGSGGGGGESSSTGGTATSGQGNNGGRGNGGGGGAGAAGANGYGAGSTGIGGIGSSAYSAWGLATNTGQNSGGTVYYAGGGGGYGSGPAVAAGGLGGGAQAGNVATIPNTGGGGGADASSQGGASGIVIIRYAMV
jgi:hypothetical protein